MGAGTDQKTANKQLTEQGQRTQNAQGTFGARNEFDLNASRGKADDLYGSISSGYKGLATGAPVPGSPASSPSGGGGGGGGGGGDNRTGSGGEVSNAYRSLMASGGGISAAENADIGNARGGYQKFMDSGGWDPTQVASIRGNVQGLKDIGKTGGIDETGQARMRGNGVFDEFANTGGYSAGDQANIRARATSTIPAFYSQLKDEANRQSSIQGGYGPGRQAMMSRFGRQQASAGADAALNAELGIKEAVNAGRQWGSSNVAGAESGLQGQLVGNKLAGLRGASADEQAQIDSANRGKMFGTEGINSIGQAQRAAEMQAAKERAMIQLQATGGMQDAANSDRNFGLASSAQGAANSHWDQQFALQKQGMGLEGLSSLYGASPTEYQQNKDFALQNTFGSAGAVGDTASRLKAGNKTWMDKLDSISNAYGKFTGMG